MRTKFNAGSRGYPSYLRRIACHVGGFASCLRVPSLCTCSPRAHAIRALTALTAHGETNRDARRAIARTPAWTASAASFQRPTFSDVLGLELDKPPHEFFDLIEKRSALTPRCARRQSKARRLHFCYRACPWWEPFQSRKMNQALRLLHQRALPHLLREYSRGWRQLYVDDAPLQSF